ncbi:ABC transporter substrate-binding protein [Mobilicoccus massiliensis]|uniref:ABC transporter substrate-binding protein n=1 Tax=Mobilicoccus massiliensis TaxID=1522310 RepID=UPI000590CD65|nr:ABC transporter substrate-binding protein [Mobilicoccus massiliensis]
MAPTTYARIGALAATLALTGSLCACGATPVATENASGGTSTPASGNYPMTVDDCGTTVTVEEAPRKVLTIGQAAVGLLDAAGASDRIVARSGEFGAELPPGLRTPPTSSTILDPADPKAEAILDSGADTVVGYGLFEAEPSDLSKAGITLLTVQGECGHDTGDSGPGLGIDVVPADVRRLGTVFGTSEVAEKSAAGLEAEIERLTTRKGSGTAAWVYYFGATDPLSAYGGTGIAHDVLARTGLTNVFASQKKTYVETSPEALLAQDPDWIVLSYGGYGESKEAAEAKFRAEKGAATLSAVKNDRIILVPSDSSAPSPRVVEALKAVADAVTGA